MDSEIERDEEYFSDPVLFKDLQVQLVARYLDASNGLIGYIIDAYNQSIRRIVRIFEKTIFIRPNGNFRLTRAKYYKPTSSSLRLNDKTSPIYPQEALTRNENYYASLTFRVERIPEEGRQATYSPEFELLQLPVMLRSNLCHLKSDSWRQTNLPFDPELNEVPNDPGGYFVMKHEKVLMLQNHLAFNMIIVRADAKLPRITMTIRDDAISKQVVITRHKIEKELIFYLNYDSSKVVDNIRGINIITAFNALGVKTEHIKAFMASMNPKDDTAQVIESLMVLLESSIRNVDEYEQIIYEMDIEYSYHSDTRTARDLAYKNFLDSVFHHIPTKEGKAQLLMFMLVKLLRTITGLDKQLNISSDSNKQFQTPGIIIEKRIQQLWKSIVKKVKDSASISDPNSLANFLASQNMSKLLADGFIGTSWGGGLRQTTGVTDYVNRDASIVSVLGMLTRIKVPARLGAGKSKTSEENRIIQPTQVGTSCLVQTPDSEAIGVTRNTAFAGRISLEVDNASVWASLFPKIRDLLTGSRKKRGDRLVFFNATLVGWGNIEVIFDRVREYRRQGKIQAIDPYSDDKRPKSYYELGLYLFDETLWINTTGGRPISPRIVLYKREYVIIRDSKEYVFHRFYTKPFGENSWVQLLETGAVEYIDTMEINSIVEGGFYLDFLRDDKIIMDYINRIQTVEDPIAFYEKYRYFAQMVDRTHLLIDPTAVFGISASMIPFVGYQQTQRTVYGAKMNEQALNKVISSYPLIQDVNVQDDPELIERLNQMKFGLSRHFGLKVRSLLHADRALVCTTGQKRVQGSQTSINNLIVAFMALQGNQEDSIIIDRNLMDFNIGLTQVVETHTFTERNEAVSSRFFHPLPGPNEGIDRYDHLDRHGVPEIGSILHKGDIIIGVATYQRVAGKRPDYIVKRELLFDIEDTLELYLQMKEDELYGLNQNTFIDVSAKYGLELVPPFTFDEFIDTLVKRFETLKEEVRKTPIDMSKSIRYDDERPGYVDQVVKFDVGPNQTVRVNVRSPRKVMIADKQTPQGFSQKATIGDYWLTENMPFLENGERVSIIINSLSLPGRMTNSWLLQILTGTMDALAGTRTTIDFSRPLDPEFVKEQLVKMGWSAHGIQPVYDGITGELYDGDIFVGLSPTELLKHQVDDKIKSRAEGPVNFATGNPVKTDTSSSVHLSGMEIDGIFSHGASAVARERIIERAPVEIIVCKNCGLQARYSDTKFICMNCGSHDTLFRAIISKPVRALSNILAGANIVLKFTTQTPKIKTAKIPTGILADEDDEEEGDLDEDKDEEDLEIELEEDEEDDFDDFEE